MARFLRTRGIRPSPPCESERSWRRDEKPDALTTFLKRPDAIETA